MQPECISQRASSGRLNCSCSRSRDLTAINPVVPEMMKIAALAVSTAPGGNMSFAFSKSVPIAPAKGRGKRTPAWTNRRAKALVPCGFADAKTAKGILQYQNSRKRLSNCPRIPREEVRKYGSFQSGAKYGIYRYEQPPLAKQGIVLKGKGLVVANAFAARRLGLYPCGLIPYQPGEDRRNPRSGKGTRKSRISTCKHWLSGLLKCSVCGATLSYTGNGKCPYFQCWKYAKGFHKTSVALSVKKAEEAVIEYFDQVLAGADFTYVRKEQPAADETAAIEQLQKELSKLSARESRIRDAYESGIDSLEEYKANKERLISNRLQLETELEKLRKEQAEKEVNKEDVLHEIKSVNDILKNPDVSYEEKGTLIRTIVDQIVYDKESGKMYFDIIVS